MPHNPFRGMVLAGLVLVLVACGPVTEEERAFFEAREEEREQERMFQQKLTEWNSVEGAIEMVRAEPAPGDRDESNEEWIERRRTAVRGEVMFPRWEANRVGANRFIVQYTHTVIDEDYNIERTGFRWDVDTLLKQIEGPVTIDPEEWDTRSQRPAIPARREVATEDFSLE